MKGIAFAIAGGAFITLQGVANSRIGKDIGSWQTATITQFTGFFIALMILLALRDRNWRRFREVKPVYLIGGAFGAVVVFSNITAIHHIGVTLTIATLLIAQLGLTFMIDRNGWFDVVKQNMRLPQFVGIGMMVAGVLILCRAKGWG